MGMQSQSIANAVKDVTNKVNPASPTATPQQITSGQSKGKSSPQQSPVVQQPAPNPMGLTGNVTYPGQGGQPQMGAPNPYANTIVSSDNQPTFGSKAGKGKG